LLPGTPAKLGKQSAQEGTEHGAGQLRVVGTSVTEWIGQGEHPLPAGDFGKYAVYQVRSGIGHATTATGRAEAATLAREGDEAIVPAVVAVKAKEAVGQHAATKVGAERLLDEARSVLVSRSRAGEEGLELVGDGPMEERLFRRSPGVRALSGACRGSSMGSVRGSMLPVVPGGACGEESVARHSAAAVMRVPYRPRMRWVAAARGIRERELTRRT
jgi:hypothetical protein